MSDLSIGDQRFRIEVEGDASRPAVILSNSLGADLGMWAPQMAALTQHFRVVRYDPRGHGGTPVAAGPVSIAMLGADVVDLLDALDIEKAHFLGLSMGGAVGLWLLANAPDRIERAVLANTAPVFGDPASWNARIASVLADGMDATTDATMERWFSPGFAEREPNRVAAIRDVMGRTSPQGYAACCAALRDLDLRETLAGIGHEILVVSGTDDPVVPTPTLDAFVSGLAGAKHVALACRHLSNVEAADAFNAAVIDFLTAKPGRSRAPARRVARPPVAPGKTAKRGGATRRSNAARAPLTTGRAAKSAARKTRTKPDTTAAAPEATRTAPARRRRADPTTNKPSAATKRTASPSRAPGAGRKPRTAAKARTAATTRATAKTRAAVKTRVAGKTPAKKTAAKARKTAATKPVTTRRKTKTSAARAPVKKTAPRKAATKAAPKKLVRKAAAKKPPAPRRGPAKKPRRPTGRRT